MASDLTIGIEEVLYEYDGPAIFVGKVGYFDSLFIRIDETDDTLKFLSCHIDDRTLAALRDGRVSVYGAVAAFPQLYIVTTDFQLAFQKEEMLPFEKMPPDLLPEKGAGLYPRFGECPDVVQEEDSYVSVYFKGPELSRKSISIATLRHLFKVTHNFLRNSLPEEMQNTRSSTVDFPVGDPALGSLMISVKKPVFTLSNLSRRDKYKTATRSDVVRELYTRKNAFIHNIEEVLEAARDGDTQKLHDEYVTYENIKPLLPTEDTAFSDVLISSAVSSEFQRFSFNRETSKTLERAYAKLENSVVIERGKITEINSGSKSLLLDAYRGRTVTCKFSTETFRRLETIPLFKNGSHMGLQGMFQRRTQRDLLDVRRVKYLGELPAIGDFDKE